MNTQSGNVLFIILIAVALFAALGFAVSQGNQNSGKTINEEQAGLYATEILEYAQSVANAVGQLRLRGCDETEISFENDIVSGYTNANAPSDNTCHVFHPEGGGLNWKIHPAEALASTTAPNDSWAIYISNEIEEVGTTINEDESVDLTLFLKNLSLNVCLEINDLVNVQNTSGNPPTDSGVDDDFIGTLNYADTVGDEDSNLAGKKAACYEDGGKTLTPANQYLFYKVLIVR